MIDDSFRTFPMRKPGTEPPYACCSRDGEPLIATVEFPGAEFVCAVCGVKYGFMAPVAKAPTPELAARLVELEALWASR